MTREEQELILPVPPFKGGAEERGGGFWVLLLFLLFPLLGFGQSPHPILTALEAFKQPNGVVIRWTIAGGGQCQGIKIYRSLDEVNFSQIGFIDGVCGSTDSEETYSYFDSIPEPNKYNHYQLELGFQGFTSIVTAFFEDFGGQNYSLLSDYQNNTYRILYSNDLKNEAVLEIYDRFGNVIYADSSTNSDITFKTNGWRSGLYIFRISGVSEADIRGTFSIGG